MEYFIDCGITKQSHFHFLQPLILLQHELILGATSEAPSARGHATRFNDIEFSFTLKENFSNFWTLNPYVYLIV